MAAAAIAAASWPPAAATDHAATATHSAPLPSQASMKDAVITVRLIDCIAATPSGAERRASPPITNDENAKNTPATSPQPSAVTRVRRSSAVMPRIERRPRETVYCSESHMYVRADMY